MAKAGLIKDASCHTSVTRFATDLLGDAYDIRTVQELLGSKDVQTTMTYTHVLNRGGRSVRSPLDTLSVQDCYTGQHKPRGHTHVAATMLLT